MRRIFIAIPISKNLQEEILRWEEKSMVRLRLPQLRWLAGKNLHITIIPPWYANDSELENVKIEMEKISGVGCFEMNFEKVEYGPDPRRPRLIWASGETPKQLLNLKSKIENALGTEPEKRLFKLHLTLARFRPEDFPAFPIKKLNEKVFWQNRAEKFVIMESRLSRGGADYEVLEQFQL